MTVAGANTMDTNLNVASCIEHSRDFGSTVVHNICNGTMQVVPWGSFDWTLAVLAGLALATVIITVIAVCPIWFRT